MAHLARIKDELDAAKISELKYKKHNAKQKRYIYDKQ